MCRVERLELVESWNIGVSIRQFLTEGGCPHTADIERVLVVDMNKFIFKLA